MDLNRPDNTPSVDPVATCLGCGYRLSGLPSRQCPECGRRFDPSDRRTMGGPWTRPIGPRTLVVAWVLCPGPLWFVAGVLLEYVVAWLSLGHRPRPSVDDPVSISMPSSLLHDAVGFSLSVMPGLTIGAVLVAAFCLAGPGPRRPGVLLLVCALAAWPLAWAIAAGLGPTGVFDWWFD